MQEQPWHIEQHRAYLRTDKLSAIFDARCPGQGLTAIAPWGENALTGFLLAVGSDFGADDRAVEPSELYCRGNDLVVGYENLGQDLQTLAYWRARTGVDTETIDLQVSVHTDLLDNRPALLTSTCLPSGDVFRLKGKQGQDFESVDLSGNRTVELSPDEGEGCLLWRWPGKNYSYAEMIHGNDFGRDELTALSGPDPMCRLVHHLFPGEIEKGVILRARVRGLFVDRADDQNRVAAEYAQFVNEAPPLAV